MPKAIVPASINNSACPGCGSSDLVLRGRLPDADYFAGRNLDPPLPGGSLYACQECALNFRWPRMTKEEADALYSEGEDDNWSSPAERRPDWQLAREWISEIDGGSSVLDVACFDGRFLLTLEEQYDRCGIEIHPVAAKRASDKGIEIVAEDVADLKDLNRQFSIITAFDILEHMHAPHEFLESVAGALEPDGIAIIGTGNSDARSWKFMGTNYWYCSIMEHVSFINPKWCEIAAAQLGLEVVRLARVSHCYPTVTKICRELTMNVLHRAAPRTCSTLRHRYANLFRPHKRVSRNDKPAWFSAKDHLLVVFRKPGCGIDGD